MKAFERLLEIMDELREKCPWDREQTLDSLRNLTIEETYELADAIPGRPIPRGCPCPQLWPGSLGPLNAPGCSAGASRSRRSGTPESPQIGSVPARRFAQRESVDPRTSCRGVLPRRRSPVSGTRAGGPNEGHRTVDRKTPACHGRRQHRRRLRRPGHAVCRDRWFLRIRESSRLQR